jgi:hypothetical protein
VNNELFKSWMQEPGKVKKLQLWLVISIVINLALGLQLIKFIQETDIKPWEKHKANNQEATTKSKSIDEDSTENSNKQISKEDLDSFIQEYLKHFFGTEKTDLEFVEKSTDPKLFEEQIYPEIIKRAEMKLKSNFILVDKYTELINRDQARIIISGREEFADENYAARIFDIELIVDLDSNKIKSIPRFQVKQ